MIKFLGDGSKRGACFACRYTMYGAFPCTECKDASNWEAAEGTHKETMTALQGAIGSFLKALPDHGYTERGRIETPVRYTNALLEMLNGYDTDIPSIFKVFDDIPSDQLVTVSNIHFCSMCEHHMLPFFGVAHIGYLPVDKRVVGISKLARLFYAYAHRLQVQERIGQQVIDAIKTHLGPGGAICVIQAEHLCMTSRGVRAEGSKTVTSALYGVFDNPVVRQEFYHLAGV